MEQALRSVRRRYVPQRVLIVSRKGEPDMLAVMARRTAEAKSAHPPTAVLCPTPLSRNNAISPTLPIAMPLVSGNAYGHCLKVVARALL